MRRTLIKIHAYLGLFCLPYLLIFALSSLNFNHKLFRVEAPNLNGTSWSRDLVVPDTLEDRELARLVNDSLGIMGWYIPWDAVRDSSRFKYETVHFGRKYEVDLSFPGRVARISAFDQPIGSIIKGLHFLGEDLPGAPWWVNSWPYYQDLTVYCMMFWFITGIYFWITKSGDRVWGTRVLIAGLIFSIFLMLYIWMVG